LPIITIDWFGGRSPEKMAAIAEEITQVMAREAEVQANEIWVRFADTPPDHWAIGGKLQS
jgi:4-oxalocrotonate tautomerase